MNIQNKISSLENKVLNGKGISPDEAFSLLEVKERSDLQCLFTSANRIKEKFRGDSVDLCSLVNAKSGNCSENCAFCAQSSHNKADVNVYKFISKEEIIKQAGLAFKNKAHRFCIITSGCTVNEEEFKQVCEAIRQIRVDFPSFKIDASLGKLTKEQAVFLKEAGLNRYNHNIETSKEFFDKVCTTHSFQDRLNTIKILKEVGIETCCGGIIGLGESEKQRVEFAFYLKELDVDCIPVNFLNPIKGTPFENNAIPQPLELLKLISIFRFILPKKQIRICGGREKNLRQLQSLIFFAGADAIILGNYLTTKGNEPNLDLEMISDLGLKF